MEINFKTPQERFWAGEFGDDYIGRNITDKLLASNVYFFSNILSFMDPVNKILEFGSNVGMNLKALKQLLPGCELSGIEINKKAFNELVKIEGTKGYNTTILDFNPEDRYDFVLIKTVLIHINPEELQEVYQKLYDSSSKYICIAEYYNPTPVEVVYRGNEGKLFKRDFAGEMLQKFPDLKLLRYGFQYHKDHLFPQDDITWFLLKK